MPFAANGHRAGADIAIVGWLRALLLVALLPATPMTTTRQWCSKKSCSARVEVSCGAGA
jgi:hypothetical protein